MVKAWFDRPVAGDPSLPADPSHLFLGHDLRDPRFFDRSRRLIDTDGDPSTGPLRADGSPGSELYRQGREIVPGMPHLDLFHKPYRGSIVTSLMGTPDGPDLLLEDRPGVVDLLDRLNRVLLPDQQSTGRIDRIAIFGPRSVPGDAGFRRLGIASVEVSAARYATLNESSGIPESPVGSRPLARATIRFGLAEIPLTGPRGPLETCGDLTVRGKLRAHWGRILSHGTADLGSTMDELDDRIDSAYPYVSYGRRIHGDELASWTDTEDASIEDPWLKIVPGGDLAGWETFGDHPFPFDPAGDVDRDHSNIFQRVPGATCSSLDYALWKRLVRTGGAMGRSMHYFAYDSRSGLFRLDGAGPARSVRDWTHGREGIFFFDTADSSPPRAGNLTPEVVISGGDWWSSGLIYLNARSFQAENVVGTTRILLPPGEPFDDPDHSGEWDPGEATVNLRYPTSMNTGTPADEFYEDPLAFQSASATSPGGETYTVSTTPGHDSRGIPLTLQVNFFGVLYNSGEISADGDVLIYGSMIAEGDIKPTGAGTGTPVVFFDERLNSGVWPPAEIEMPRTYVTFWQTSRS